MAEGWLDWPARWLNSMEHALTAYRATLNYQQALAAYEGDDLKAWQERNPDTMRAVLWIEECAREVAGGHVQDPFSN